MSIASITGKDRLLGYLRHCTAQCDVDHELMAVPEPVDEPSAQQEARERCSLEDRAADIDLIFGPARTRVAHRAIDERPEGPVDGGADAEDEGQHPEVRVRVAELH